MTEVLHENDNDKRVKNDKAALPKNIKQIGDISSDKKIFIEDYAFSYMNSIAFANTGEEGAGVLLGETSGNGKEKNIFIKGIIKIKNAAEHKGIYFDQTTWRFIYSDIEKYFPKLEIVGWFAYTPDLNPEKMQFLNRMHRDNFSGPMKTLYLINSSEKDGDFYLFEKNKLIKQPGYVCYYEKNYEMQEYMIEKRGNKPLENTANDKVVRSIRNVIREKEEHKEARRQNMFLYGILICMTIVVVVVGVNFVNSYEKMKSFDRSISNMVNEIDDLNNRDSINVSGSVYQTQNEEETAETEESSDIVKVNRLEGNVYPQEETTAAEEVTTTTQAVTASTDMSSKTSETEKSYSKYIVKQGDTIMSICKDHYGSYSRYKEVMDVNNINDSAFILVGQELRLPV